MAVMFLQSKISSLLQTVKHTRERSYNHTAPCTNRLAVFWSSPWMSHLNCPRWRLAAACSTSTQLDLPAAPRPFTAVTLGSPEDSTPCSEEMVSREAPFSSHTITDHGSLVEQVSRASEPRSTVRLCGSNCIWQPPAPRGGGVEARFVCFMVDCFR